MNKARLQAAEARRRAADARRRAAEARRRAAEARLQAAEVSASFGEQAATTAVLLSHFQRLADLHERVWARLLASAELQDRYADGLAVSSGDAEPWAALMDAVAAAIGTPSAAVVLFGRQRGEAVAAASDATARAAHDLEFVLGEGPAHLAISDGQRVEVAGKELHRHWPQYGPAVAGLGVQAVVAVPLQPPARLGAVCAYSRDAAIGERVAAAAGRIADALPVTLAQAAGGAPPGDDVPGLPLFGETAFPSTVHQAAGMVSQQRGCGIADSLALLRARAFSSGCPAGEVAAAVLRGELRL